MLVNIGLTVCGIFNDNTQGLPSVRYTVFLRCKIPVQTDYGLSSILIFDRDLNAAEFFNSRALYYAERAGVDYSAAKQDRELILRFKQS